MAYKIITTLDKVDFISQLEVSFTEPEIYIVNGNEESFAINKQNQIVYTQILASSTPRPGDIRTYEVIEEYSIDAFLEKYNSFIDFGYSQVGPVQFLIKENNIQVFLCLLVIITS